MATKTSTCRWCGQPVSKASSTAAWIHTVNSKANCPTSLAAPIEDVPDEEQV